MSSIESTAPMEISKKRDVKISTALLFTLLAATAVGAIAWSAVKSQGDANAAGLEALKAKQALDIKETREKQEIDHDVLTEIRTDVKTLLRDKRP
jgi:hypothetical protein